MAKTATTSVQVSVSGDGYQTSSTGPLYSDVQTNTGASTPSSVTLATATFLALTIPATATAITIVPPANNTATLTLKGITGDTGLVLGAITNAIKIPFVAGSMASIGLLASAASTWGVLWG